MIYIKAFVCSLVILAIMISGFWVNYIVLKNKSQILTNKLEILKSAVENNDEKRISSSFDDILHHWKKHNKYMLMFSNHSNLDTVSISFIKIKENIRTKNYSDLREEIELAISALSSIPQNETLELENIF